MYAKDKNVARAKAAPKGAGDAWTWTAIDAESKLIISYLLSGKRDGDSAIEFMDDLRDRIEDRPQITTDSLSAYVEAVEGAFGGDVDFAQQAKLYNQPGSKKKGDERIYSPSTCIGTRKRRVEGNPDPELVSTSYIERQNLTMWMGMRRFTRLTNAFSKRTERLVAMLHLYFVHYNFCRVHKSLRVTPAMEAGIDDTVRSLEWVVGLVDANAPKPKKPGPKIGTKYEKSN